jgi:serine/threonine protein kinase
LTPVAGTIVAERFRLMRPLGQGGMGSVWLAQHIGLDVPCAIKFMHASDVSDEVRLRFVREGRVAAQIRSPHVVQILDHGVWEGAPYIAMEYLEGEDLDDRIRRVGRLGPRETLAIVAQVSRALTRAHAAGLVHRDLKPANIFIVHDDDREIAKVLDFGIAKDSTPRVASTTKTGSLLGTPAYMSPEQAQGTKNVDHRSDLWSLAVVVFECLTGKLPFDSEAFGDLLLKIMVKPLPIPSQVAPVPAGFDAWWARAASREPEARFQSARELSDALAIALDISMVDSFDSRTSVSGLLRVSGERASMEFGPAPRSRETPVFSDRTSVPLSLGDAVTLVASDAEGERSSARGAVLGPVSASGVGQVAVRAQSTPRMRPQTAGALVSVVAPPAKRSGQGMRRVLAAAVVGALFASTGGFFLLRSGRSTPGQAAALPDNSGAAPLPSPAVEKGPEPPLAVEPTAAAGAGAASSAPAISARPSSTLPPAPPGLPPAPASAPLKLRPAASTQPPRRKPKLTDFGI